MQVDGSLLVRDPGDAGPAARRLEELGYDGGFTFEGPHDPFLPLAVAAVHTEKLVLGTAVAIAFARNPMLLANLGYDLQLASKGRFILGLGTQIKPHVERRFGMPWSRPVARMQELIRAIRAIWACWQDGAPLDFRGDFYTHTLMTPVFNPGPSPYGLPPIFAGGVGAEMVEAVATVADGLIVHPFNTPEFVRSTTLPAIERGLARAGRSRSDFVVSCQLIMAVGDGDEERARAKDAARLQIAFYASTPAYRPVLDCHGCSEIQTEANRLSKQGRWLEMAALVDDELLARIAVVAGKSEAAAVVHERCAGVADRVTFVSPLAERPEVLAGVAASLRE